MSKKFKRLILLIYFQKLKLKAINSKMDVTTKVNGLITNDMGMVYIHGLQVLNMKENISMIGAMVTVS